MPLSKIACSKLVDKPGHRPGRATCMRLLIDDAVIHSPWDIWKPMPTDPGTSPSPQALLSSLAPSQQPLLQPRRPEHRRLFWAPACSCTSCRWLPQRPTCMSASEPLILHPEPSAEECLCLKPPAKTIGHLCVQVLLNIRKGRNPERTCLPEYRVT